MRNTSANTLRDQKLIFNKRILFRFYRF